MSYTVIIPARLAAQRLPNKVLLHIDGKSIIQHVYQRAQQSKASQVIIATDSAEVIKEVELFSGKSCLTYAKHSSGTSRLAEAVDILGLADDEIIVNVQGDEPLIPPAIIDQVAENLRNNPEASIATLCETIVTAEELFNPNVVKVVVDKNNMALYFSRAPIAWERDHFMQDKKNIMHKHYRHIGLYAYRAGFIKQYVEWGACELEKIESLEQLRALWNGANIHVAQATAKTYPGVDTEDDLQFVRTVFANKKPA